MPSPKRPPPRRPKRGEITHAKREARDIARTLTLDNPRVRSRLLKECEEGTIAPRVFVELLHYSYGCPPKVMRVEGAVKGLFQFITRHPRDYDPLAQPSEEVILESLPPGSDR